MANLYDINSEIEQLLEAAVDPETGELDEAAIEALDKLELARAEKIEGIALKIKNLKSDIEAFKAEKKKFDDKITSASKELDSIKTWLEFCLNGEKFKSPRVSIYYNRSKAVQIGEGVKLPEKYLRFIEPEPDKIALKNAIQGGEQIEGVELVENVSMVIR